MKKHHATSLQQFIFWAMMLWVAIVAIAYLLRPICDPDFFWHLKTGEWIWKHRALPLQDYYSFNPPHPLDDRSRFILTSYWLSQLWYWFWYSFSGWSGIFIARILVAAVAFVCIVKWRPLQSTSHYALILLGIIQTGEPFQLDRPQVMSFVLFCALLTLLGRFLEKKETEINFLTYSALIAALMIAWANIHGGFLVGLILLITIAIAEGVKYLHPSLQPLEKKQYQILASAVAITLFASTINPNPMISYKIGFALGQDHDSFNYTRIKEYYSAYKSLTELHGYTILINWFVMGLCIFFVTTSKNKPDITWITLLAGTAVAANLHVRYMPFFVIVSIFYLLQKLDEPSCGNTIRTAIISIALVSSLVFSVDEFGNLIQRYRSGSEPDPFYPDKAADYLVSNKVQGPILNIYGWGGYLIWRLGENANIFCDGRQLDPVRFKECANMFDIHDRSYWKSAIDRYKFTTAILPVYHKGKPYSLSQLLYNDPQWSLVFNMNNSVIFRKNQNL